MSKTVRELVQNVTPAISPRALYPDTERMKDRIRWGTLALVTALICVSGLAIADDLTLTLRPIGKPAAKKPNAKTATKALAAAKPGAKPVTAAPRKDSRVAVKTLVTKLPAKVVARALVPQTIQKIELVAVNAPETTLAETSGVIVEHSYVIVPFDVIASVALHRGEPAFFVGAQRVHATLVDFDLTSNQALLKTDTSFTEGLTLTSIRQQWPRAEEPIIASQGVGGQRFSGKIHEISNDGVVSRFTVPSPFSAQNVESFAFDPNGNLLGMRSREQDDYSPSAYTYQLVSKVLQKQPASSQGLLVKLHQQWTALQSKWAEALIQDASRLRMQQWQVGLGTKMLKCQPLHARVADRNLAALVNRAEGQSCVNRASTKVDIDYQPGVETVSGVGNLRGDVDGAKWNSLTSEMALSFFSPYDSDIQAVSLFTAPICEENSARSRNGQELRIHFCTSSLKAESGLNDSVFFVTTRQPAGDGFAFSGIRLKGFDQTNSKALVWAVMESFKGLK